MSSVPPNKIKSRHNDEFVSMDSSLRSNLSNRRNLSSNERSLSPYRPPASKGLTFYQKTSFPGPVECEIITNKMQKCYSEFVAERIKQQIGIPCNIRFLNDETLFDSRINYMANQGRLYAIVISPQNETYKSITVCLLQGKPQEHRNMPLEDAVNLLARNFHDHIRPQREYMERERTARGQYIGIVADHEVQFLLRMLADGRRISLPEINIIIHYLTQRRDNMQTSYDVLFGKNIACSINPAFIYQIINSKNPEVQQALVKLMQNPPNVLNISLKEPRSYGNQNQFNKSEGPGPYNYGEGMEGMPHQNYGVPRGIGGLGGGAHHY